MKRIAIVDDHNIIRIGLKLIIEQHDAFEVVGDYALGVEFIDDLDTLNPDIILLDIELPDSNGLDLIPSIIKNERSKVLILTSHDNFELVKKSLLLGASGFLNKDCDANVLLSALRSVDTDGFFIDPSLTSGIMEETLVKKGSPLDVLSDREIEIFDLLVKGLQYQEIGEQLFISHKTVEKHKRNILEKLELDSIQELVLLAVREGRLTIL